MKKNYGRKKRNYYNLTVMTTNSGILKQNFKNEAKTFYKQILQDVILTEDIQLHFVFLIDLYRSIIQLHAFQYKCTATLPELN